MITKELTHHGKAFAVVAEDWGHDSEGAAMAVDHLLAWVESQNQAQSRTLHHVLAANQNDMLRHLPEIGELRAAEALARAYALADRIERPFDARSVILRAD